MFYPTPRKLHATRTRTWCHSGCENSRGSDLKTHSLLSSQRDSESRPRLLLRFHPRPDSRRREPRTPAVKRRWCGCAVCICACLAKGGPAAPATLAAARISDKPNESPGSCYLLARSCSVLSSLFSDSGFSFVFSVAPASPLARFLCSHAASLRAKQASLVGSTSMFPPTPAELNGPNKTSLLIM